MEDILKYLFANLNGMTESILLFILIFYDTFLGSRWRKNKGIARTSDGGLGGLRRSLPLAFLPVLIWVITIVMSIAPTHIGGRDVIYSPMLFDFVSFAITVTVANYLLKSILANMKLAGMYVPKFFAKWIEDEFHVKIQYISEEPNSAEKDRNKHE